MNLNERAVFGHTAAVMCKQLNLIEFKCLAVGQSGFLFVQYKRKGHARTCKDLFVLSPSTPPDPKTTTLCFCSPCRGLLSLFSPVHYPDSAKLNQTGLYCTHKNITAVGIIHNSERGRMQTQETAALLNSTRAPAHSSFVHV